MSLPEKIASIKDKVDALEKRIAGMDHTLKKFEGLILKIEKVIETDVSREKKLESFAKEIESRLMDFEKRDRAREEKQNRTISDINKNFEEFKKMVLHHKKEVDKTIETLATQKDLSRLKESLEKTNISLKDSVLNTIKEFKKINSDLQKDYSEAKMDIAATESGIKSQIEQLSGDLGMIKNEMDKFPKIQELKERDVDLYSRLEVLEKKFGAEFESLVNGFKKVGELFTLKAEFERIEKRQDDVDKKLEQRADIASGKIKEIVDEMEAVSNRFKERMEEESKIRNELNFRFDILKEQIVTTQNAIVELNSFLQEQLTKKEL